MISSSLVNCLFKMPIERKSGFPRQCRQAVILNLEVQGGRKPDASGAPSVRSAQQHHFSSQPVI
ncbi:hypothetical protein BCL69_107019 [Nitrosomonas communis]|uniref:Uncharacterized protein n=1 Tax=Nitrosomonas communis TaxID=44574 RepID=A0A5D3YAR6_9PROT|nr:hypothetical protein BCL69_107019 [Nitrosomonas communis]